MSEVTVQGTDHKKIYDILKY